MSSSSLTISRLSSLPRQEFSKGYDLSISLFGNSCEDYATQLVAHLLVE